MTSNMDEYFKSQYLSEFSPDCRANAIYEKWVQYYKDTPDSMNNKNALVYYKELQMWLKNHEVSRLEIHKAKVRALHTIKQKG